MRLVGQDGVASRLAHKRRERLLAALLLALGIASAQFFGIPSASAYGTCGQSTLGRSLFDGWGAYNINGNDGSPYRGVGANISTRLGYSCSPPSPTPAWYNSSYNFTTAWVMLANPDGVHGLAQAGFFRFNGGSITSFAETNPDGNSPVRRVYPTTQAVGQTHNYQADYQTGCACIALYVDQILRLSTDYDPVALWGSGRWAVESFGEVKDPASDMPGKYGTSTLFSAFGTKTSTQGYVGNIAWTSGRDDNPGAWARGATNEFPVGTYGYNFQIYSY